ncbi:MAG TPA: PEP-CTERM sorting domain-containing protein [Pyrinomonadaceae bacterium]|nr:PEP-CTERM sorting domain-containing protein [Pyrinomonadaceae bacterium]
MRHLAYRPIAVMLCLLLAAAVPAHAGPVNLADVIQLIVARQDGRVDMDLRLRSGAQGGQTPVAANGVASSNGGGTQAKGSAVGASSSGSDTISTSLQDNSATIETIDVGEVTGTICECGEILLPSDEVAGFPKWPLFALAAVPLFFLNGGNGGNGGDTDSFSQPPPVVTIPNTPVLTTPTPTPPPVLTPTPTPILTPTPPQPIPEPATLLLFGSGLLALGAEKRRRHARRNRTGTSAETEGGQSC